jgi:type I restriction enzyme M protein
MEKTRKFRDGWIGHIMPFELVQETYLHKELQSIKQKESRLVDITSQYEEILDSLTEDEKESETVNEAKDGFVNTVVTKEAKQIKTTNKILTVFEEDSYEAKILKVAELIDEEKELKKKVKSETAKLHLQTKATIEKLTDEQVYELLELKWISPLVTSLNNLPNAVIDELTAKVLSLSEKYATTYSNIAEEIVEAESALSSLIDELDGNEFDMKGLNEFKSLLKGE